MSNILHLPRMSSAIPAAVHPDVRIARLCRALAYEGLCVSNTHDGRLLIHDSPEYRATGEVPGGAVPPHLRWPDGPENAA
jgi:hypothetical protein